MSCWMRTKYKKQQDKRSKEYKLKNKEKIKGYMREYMKKRKSAKIKATDVSLEVTAV